MMTQRVLLVIIIIYKHFAPEGCFHAKFISIMYKFSWSDKTIACEAVI